MSLNIKFKNIALYQNNMSNKKMNSNKVEKDVLEQKEMKTLKVFNIPLYTYQANSCINFGDKNIVPEDFAPFDKQVVDVSQLNIPIEWEKYSSVDDVQQTCGRLIVQLFLNPEGRKKFLNKLAPEVTNKDEIDKVEQVMEQWASYLLDCDILGTTNLTKIYILSEVLDASLDGIEVAPIDKNLLIKTLSTISKIKNFATRNYFVAEYNKAYKNNFAQN